MQELSKSSEVSFAYRRTLISAYREAMREQFKSYISLHHGFPPNQHRDTIWTFLAGWHRCLHNTKNVLELSLFAREFGHTFGADWRPGAEWIFWD